MLDLNLTPIQKLAICIGILTAVAGSSAQLTDIFLSVTVVKAIVAGCALSATILSVVLTVATSQAKQVQAVKNMPGVEPLRINDQATPALAALALDPTQDKIGPVPGKAQELQAIASSK